METSDSEYFESADEDFDSDNEKVKSEKNVVKGIKSKSKEQEKITVKEIDVLQNIEDLKTADSGGDNVEVNANKPNDNENNVSVNEPHQDENLWEDDEIDWTKANEKEENMWENDDWESVEQQDVLQAPHTQKPDNTPKQEEKSSWGSWGTWGVSSILTTATQSVSTLTQNISTVLESGIGVPDPEELARINHLEKEQTERESQPHVPNLFGFGNFSKLSLGVSELTKLVESTSTKVISGGLDTLETIGKKTMEVLQEGDPGLKKKRAFLKIDQDKPVLSQLLREAKEKAEKENRAMEEKHFAKKAVNYETIFDDHQGLVHLEALEMLSKQCNIKLQSLVESYIGEALTEMQETMDQVKELCELPEEDEEEQGTIAEITEKLEAAVSEINIPITYKKVIETWSETETWLSTLKLEVCDARELHEQGIETLAQLTAQAVEQFHKTGELLLVKEHRSTADEADSLVQLTTTLTALIGLVAAKFSDKLNEKAPQSNLKDEVNSLITNVFFEAANSSSYLQDAFQLLIPVLQVGAL